MRALSLQVTLMLLVLIVLGLHVASELLYVEQCWSGQPMAFSPANFMDRASLCLGAFVACGLLVQLTIRLTRRDPRGAVQSLTLSLVMLIPWGTVWTPSHPVSNYGHRAKFQQIRCLLSEVALSKPDSFDLPWGVVVPKSSQYGYTTYTLCSDLFNTVGLIHAPGGLFPPSGIHRKLELGDGWWWFAQ